MLPPRYREQPYRVGDVTIPAREFILLSSAAANRDPAKFPDPDHFDIRRDTRGHLGFSHGAHRCLGAELGRLEVATALGALLTAFPDISPGAPWDEIRWRPGTFMRRLYRLPVVLGRP
jgi:cytochrome P450 PksS